MARIETRQKKDGTYTYRVLIRKKDQYISKTFLNEDDAQIYALYKENLIVSMENFDVPMKEMITIEQLFELKFENGALTKREFEDSMRSMERFVEFFGDTVFLTDLGYDEWKNCAFHLMKTKVYKGAKTKAGERFMSLKSVKKTFAHASSAINFARKMGVNLHNYPLEVIQTCLNPLIKDQS